MKTSAVAGFDPGRPVIYTPVGRSVGQRHPRARHSSIILKVFYLLKKQKWCQNLVSKNKHNKMHNKIRVLVHVLYNRSYRSPFTQALELQRYQERQAELRWGPRCRERDVTADACLSIFNSRHLSFLWDTPRGVYEYLSSFFSLVYSPNPTHILVKARCARDSCFISSAQSVNLRCTSTVIPAWSPMQNVSYLFVAFEGLTAFILKA